MIETKGAHLPRGWHVQTCSSAHNAGAKRWRAQPNTVLSYDSARLLEGGACESPHHSGAGRQGMMAFWALLLGTRLCVEGSACVNIVFPAMEVAVCAPPDI
jgi:hypothetical protein